MTMHGDFIIQRFVATYRRHCVAAVCAAALAVVASGCGQEPADAQPPAGRSGEAIDVAVLPVSRTAVDRGISVTGSLVGEEETTIASEVAGQVVAVYADVGDRLTPGAPLLQIDPVEYRLTLEQRRAAAAQSLANLGLTELPSGDLDIDEVPTVRRARAERDNAQARFDRVRVLYENKPSPVSEQEFTDLQTQYEVAVRDYEVSRLSARATLAEARTRDAEARLAEQRLQDATVSAPASPTETAGARPRSNAPSGNTQSDNTRSDNTRSDNTRSGNAQAGNAQSGNVSSGNTPPSDTAPSAQSAAISAGSPSPAPQAALAAVEASSQVSAGQPTFSVARRNVSIGQYVTPGQALYELVDDNPLKYRAAVPERFAGAVSPGQTVRLEVESHREPFFGTVSRISPSIDSQSRTFMVEALIDNTAGLLRPGGFARGFIVTHQEQDVPLVPQTAVYTFAGVSKVFSVDQGKAVEHRIEPGVIQNDLLEVVGLPPGVQSVIDRPARVTQGTPVRPANPANPANPGAARDPSPTTEPPPATQSTAQPRP